MSANEKPLGSTLGKAGGKLSSWRKLDAPTSGRPRLVVFSEFERGIRDPYLLDAIRQFGRVLKELQAAEDEAQVKRCVYDLCELSRDVTVRLIPFSHEMKDVFAHARQQYVEALAAIDAKPVNDEVRLYAGNIRERVTEYEEFLDSLDRAS